MKCMMENDRERTLDGEWGKTRVIYNCTGRSHDTTALLGTWIAMESRETGRYGVSKPRSVD